jgi:ActR/RegA family two-component response regulator
MKILDYSNKKWYNIKKIYIREVKIMRKKKIKSSPESLKVFILDDDKILVEGVISFLDENGYQCDGTSIVEEAFDKMDQVKYDIIILDYFLDDYDGKKFIKKLRRSGILSCNAKIILLTGHTSLAPALESLRLLDIQGYVEKSNNFNDILIELEKLKKAIEKSRETEEQLKRSFGEKLKQLRVKNGMTQEDLAQLLGIGRTAVVAYEQGVNEPSLYNLKKLAKIFRVSIDYLAGFSLEQELQ